MNAAPQPFERIDLHTHSSWSDGVLAPAELVALAASRAVQLLALTDHDTLAGCEAAGHACAAAGIAFVPACEMTSLWRGREIHVVALRVDPYAAPLAAHLAAVRAQRRERIRAIGLRLEHHGLEGTAIAAAVLARDGTPTRLHLARELVRRGHAADEDAAFRRWLGHGQRAAVPAEWPGVAATVAAVAAAGGLAVLAHPHRYRLSAGALRELCGEFRAAGGAGIEISLPGMAPGDASRAAALARRFGLAGSCGSDFHVPGVPWRPLGRFAKLPEGIVPIAERLGLEPVRAALPASQAPAGP
ncbi:MAG: PHP domain-containing protein [Gammaproteobacteria bacterium]|nr:PHP domain-containing protein [Gammaproteobacteria bacterium]MDE2250729.1 PHP domain-containing protein [Gammaproteobacteria bacterium]